MSSHFRINSGLKRTEHLLAHNTRDFIRCPECGHMVGNNDAICLICGKKMTEKIRKKAKQQEPPPQSRPDTSNKDASAKKPKGRVIHPEKKGQPDFLGSMFSTFFLLFTVAFAFVYILRFDLVLNSTDTLLAQGKLEVAQKVFRAYEFVALSKYYPQINLRRRQIAREMRAANATRIVPPKEMKLGLRESYQDARNIVHLKLIIQNDSPASLPVIRNDYFYLKNGSHLYRAMPANSTESIGPAIIPAWKTITGGIAFPGLPEIRKSKEPFRGYLVFNNGSFYASVPLKLRLTKSEPKSFKGWTLKEISSASN